MEYILLGGSMFLAIIGQFMLKKGILASALSPNLNSIIKTIFSPFVIVGFIAYGISSIIWLFVLQKLPLSTAYPALSLTYIAIVGLSFFILKEPVSSLKIAGMTLIIAGVYFLFK